MLFVIRSARCVCASSHRDIRNKIISFPNGSSIHSCICYNCSFMYHRLISRTSIFYQGSHHHRCSWPFGPLYSHINRPSPPRPSAVFPSLPSICAVNVETTWTLLWGFKTENKSTPRCVLLNPIDLTSVIDLARILTRTSFQSIRVLLGSYLVSIAIRKA